MATATYQGLGTFTMAPNTTGQHSVKVTLELPALQDGDNAASSVVTVVKQNSTTVYTSNAGDRGLATYVTLAAGDTISVVTSSSTAIDNRSLNGMKLTVAISKGATA